MNRYLEQRFGSTLKDLMKNIEHLQQLIQQCYSTIKWREEHLSEIKEASKKLRKLKKVVDKLVAVEEQVSKAEQERIQEEKRQAKLQKRLEAERADEQALLN